MNRFFKYIFVSAFILGIIFITHIPLAKASAGGLDYATLTGPNQITVTYENVIDNNSYLSYSDLGGDLAGRIITGGTPTIDGKGIILTISGPATHSGDTGTIDIDTTVTWLGGGNFTGEDNWAVDDGQQPKLVTVTWHDLDTSGTITAGDTFEFAFSEYMSTLTIDTTNVDTRLGLNNGHTFGSVPNGMTVEWSMPPQNLLVTVGSDATIVKSDTVNPESAVTDIAGNLQNMPAPLTLVDEAPVLTEMKQIPKHVHTGNDLVYRFTTDKLCDIEANQIQSSKVRGPVSLLIEEPAIGHSLGASLEGDLLVGATYSSTFRCRDSGDNVSNDLTMGPFTILPNSSSVGGYAAPEALAKAGVALNPASPSLGDNKMCPSATLLSNPISIKIVQQHLLRLGFNPGPIDGISGKMTISAIKQAQAKLGTLADGLVGPLTRNLINNSCTKTP